MKPTHNPITAVLARSLSAHSKRPAWACGKGDKGCRSSIRICRLLTLAALTPLGFYCAQAKTVTWDGGGTNSNWDTADNWSNNLIPSAQDDVVFGSAVTSGLTISLNGNRTATSLLIDTASAFTLAGNTLTLTRGDLSRTTGSFGNQIIDSAITIKGAAAWDINGSGSLEVSGIVEDFKRNFGFTKTGNGLLILSNGIGTDKTLTVNGGMLVLSGDNNGATPATQMNGAVVVTSGVLNIRDANALGTTTAGTSVTAGAALEIQGTTTVGAEALTLNGTGIGSNGALRNVSNDNTYGGLVTLGSASRINSDSGILTLSNPGPITGNTFGLTVGGAGHTTINSGIATTSGTLTKDGSGTLTLIGSNTYSGTTTVSGGTLLVNGSNSGGGAVSVAAGATMGGSGSIAGAVTVNGGILAPGGSNSIESLATGALTLNPGSTFAYEMNSSAADLLKVNGALDLIGTVKLTLSSSGAFAPNSTLSLINYVGAWNGGFFTYNTTPLNEGTQFTAGANTWQITYGATTGGFNFASEYGGGHFINLTAVPEPGSLLALGCLIGSGVFLRPRPRAAAPPMA